MESSSAQDRPSLVSARPQRLNRTGSKCTESGCWRSTREEKECKGSNDFVLLSEEDRKSQLPS